MWPNTQSELKTEFDGARQKCFLITFNHLINENVELAKLSPFSGMFDGLSVVAYSTIHRECLVRQNDQQRTLE